VARLLVGNPHRHASFSCPGNWRGGLVWQVGVAGLERLVDVAGLM